MISKEAKEKIIKELGENHLVFVGKWKGFGIEWEDLKGYINSLLESENWISVKDKLPDNNIEVLLYVNDGLGMYVSHGYYDSEREHAKWRECSLNLMTVTHWRPLPKPPEEEQEEIDKLLESLDARPTCPTCGYLKKETVEDKRMTLQEASEETGVKL